MRSTTSLQAELLDLLQRHTGGDRLHDTPVPGLHLLRFSSPSQPLYAVQWPCLAMVAQGAKTLQVGDVQLRYQPGQYLLTSADLPVVSCVVEASRENPMLGIGITLDAELLREVTRRLDDLSRIPRASAASVQQADAPLLDAVLRLVRLLETPRDIKGLAHLIQQEILYRLLVGPAGAQLLELGAAGAAGHRLSGAVLRLRERLDLPVKVEELARDAGMSASSFHQHFKQLYRMSPIQYQKSLRLHEARRLLLTESRGVGEAGFQVGYQSPSQFTKDYRRYFGTNPRDDIHAFARAAANGTWSPDAYSPLAAPQVDAAESRGKDLQVDGEFAVDASLAVHGILLARADRQAFGLADAEAAAEGKPKGQGRE